MLRESDAVLLIIDVQERLVNSAYNKDNILIKSEIIAKTADILNIPVFITEQYPKGLGGTVREVADSIRNTGKIFREKVGFDAFFEDEIYNDFAKINRKQVIVIGLETHICVYQTVLDLISRGYGVTVAADACSSRRESEHLFGLDNMRSAGARIMTTEMVLFELLKTAKHPKFKDIQALIK